MHDVCDEDCIFRDDRGFCFRSLQSLYTSVGMSKPTTVIYAATPPEANIGSTTLLSVFAVSYSQSFEVSVACFLCDEDYNCVTLSSGADFIFHLHLIVSL